MPGALGARGVWVHWVQTGCRGHTWRGARIALPLGAREAPSVHKAQSGARMALPQGAREALSVHKARSKARMALL